MELLKISLLFITLIVIPLYPKFPLIGIGGSFVSVRIEDFVIAFVGFFWLLLAIKNKFVSLKLPVQRSILVYLFIGFASTISSILLTKSVEQNISLLHTFRRVEYFLMFFVAYDFISKKIQLFSVVKVFLVVSLIVSLFGLGQQYFKFPVISTTNSEFSKGLALSLGEGARINSTFAGHYDLAAFSLFPLMIILGLLCYQNKNRIGLFLMSIPIYLSMVLSASRVTFASFFIISTVLLVVLKKKILIIPLYVLLFITVIASPQLSGRYRELIMNHLLSIVPSAMAQEQAVQIPSDQEVPDALKPAATPEDRSLNIRLQAGWPRAVRAFEKNPLIGTGFSSVGLAVDNGYLRLLAETGLLGFLGFMLIVFRLLRQSLGYFFTKKHSFETVIILSVTMAFVGLLANALFIDIFEASKIAIITWTLMGIISKVNDLK